MRRLTIPLIVLSCGAPALGDSPLPPPAPATQPAVEELRPILSAEQKRDAACELIDHFVEHAVAAPEFAEDARRAVADAWQKHRGDDDPQDFLAAGLAILSEPFKTAVAAVEAEEYAKADAALKTILDAGDAYLALHAKALAARSLVEQERLEEAQALLEPLAAQESELIDKTFLEAEVDFLLGYCQVSNLDYDKAVATLQQFERDHPDAPERFRLPARQMLQELLVRRPESLGEVSDLMVYAGRCLGTGRADSRIRTRQTRAVELLTKLIEEAEQREKDSKGCKNCGGKGCPKCRGAGKTGAGGRPNSPMRDSMLPDARADDIDLHRSPTARPGEQWGKMRPEERERILQSLRKTFPSRYQQLVEQYYRQLAKER